MLLLGASEMVPAVNDEVLFGRRDLERLDELVVRDDVAGFPGFPRVIEALASESARARRGLTPSPAPGRSR